MYNKPITVAREDFARTIITAVNGSGLPAFVVADVLGGMVNDAQRKMNAEYTRDLRAYQAALAKEQKETEAETKAETEAETEAEE